MKTTIILLLNALLSSMAHAAIPAPQVPMGLWQFKKQYAVTNLQKAEVVPSPAGQPAKRVSELRADGFLCIHQSPTKYLCSKNETGSKLTPAQESFVFARFAEYQIEFQPTVEEPILTFDGSTQSDYFIQQKVQIIQAKYTKYGITVLQNGDTYFKFIPENEEDPNLVISFKNSIFSLPVILQTTVGNQTWGYYVSVFLN